MGSTDVNKMFCCVPECGTDTFKIVDPSITFHPFPPIPKLATKWIQQINSATIPKCKPMWFPRANSVVCSKHFQPADFIKGSLKPQAIPIIFSSNLIDFNKTLSQIQTSSTISTKPTKSLAIDGLAVPARAYKDVQIGGKTVKPHAIKDILHRASVLFARNMAITKCLEDTRSVSPAPSNENECSEAAKVSIDPLHSYTLPELNLDKALSLATLKSKHCDINAKAKHKTVLVRPFSTSKSSSETPDFSPSVNRSDSVGNKTSVVPNTSLKTSSMVQKRKHEDGSYTELIKIAPNKFLKIQRLSAKESTPSADTPLTSGSNEKPENSQSDDDVCMDSYIDDAHDSSNDHEPSMAPETHKMSDVTAKPTAIQTVPNKQPVLFTRSMALSHVSNNKLASLISPNPTPLQKLKPGNTALKKTMKLKPGNNALKKTKKLKKESPAPVAAPETDKRCNATVKSTTIQSALNKQPVLFTTNMPLNRFSNNKLVSLIPCNPASVMKSLLKRENTSLIKTEESGKKSPAFAKKSWLEEENASLKKKIAALQKKCRAQDQKLAEPIQNRLEAIREASSKGDASATYILEQIGGFRFSQRSPRWSDSTLLQCALLCRKGAYAYELFRKTDFFKLPTFQTVEKYIRKNPNLSLTSKADTLHPGNKTSNLGRPISSSSPRGIVYNKPNYLHATLQNHTNHSSNQTTSITNNEAQNHENTQQSETTTIPVTVDTSSSELREIILETGEVVQCYSTNIITGEDGYQYYIIPTDNNGQEHNDVNIQNSENAQVLPEQEHIIYINNSSHQLQCSETEVATAIEMISSNKSH